MSGSPFDREVINTRERPLSSDINQVSSYADLEIRRIVSDLYSSRVSISDNQNAPLVPLNGIRFVGGAFVPRQVGAGATMQVMLGAGTGWLNDGLSQSSLFGISGLDDLSNYKPIVLNNPETIVGIPIGAAQDRIDIIEVALDRRLTDPTSRDILDPVTGKFTPGLVNKTLTYTLDGTSTVNGAGAINYKTGTPAAVPVPPAIDAGYVRIAQIYVPALSAGISTVAIIDYRQMLYPGGTMTATLWGQNVAGVTTTIGFSGPPGVSGMVITDPASGSPQQRFLVKAGDATAFRADSIVAVAWRNGSAVGTYKGMAQIAPAVSVGVYGPRGAPILMATDQPVITGLLFAEDPVPPGVLEFAVTVTAGY